MNCEYKTYREGKLVDCGQPATHRTEKTMSNGKHRHYCPDCNALAGKMGGIKTQPISKEAK